MYTEHIEIKPCSHGQGLFTTIRIPAKAPIMEFTGKIYSIKDLPTNCSIFLQIGPERYLAPTGTVNGVDFINHSCDPNCTIRAVGNRAILYSLYVIPSGNQLTFDYSTTSTDTQEVWKMNCKCESPRCRGTISGHQYLSKEQQEEYKKRGILPLFITNPNLFNKKW